MCHTAPVAEYMCVGPSPASQPDLPWSPLHVHRCHTAPSSFKPLLLPGPAQMQRPPESLSGFPCAAEAFLPHCIPGNPQPET